MSINLVKSFTSRLFLAILCFFMVSVLVFGSELDGTETPRVNVSVKSEDIAQELVTSLIEELRRRDESPELEAALVGIGSEAVPAILRMFHPPFSMDQGMAAARILSRIGPDAQGAVPKIVSLLEKGGTRFWKVDCALIGALDAIKPGAEVLLPALDKCLDYSQPDVKYQAALAICNVGPPAKSLVKKIADGILKDCDDQMRLSLLDSLARLGPDADAAVPVIVLMAVNGGNIYVRMKSLETLGSIGPAANGAVSVLQVLEDNKDGRIKVWAKYALVKVDFSNSRQYILDLISRLGVTSGSAPRVSDQAELALKKLSSSAIVLSILRESLEGNSFDDKVKSKIQPIIDSINAESSEKPN